MPFETILEDEHEDDYTFFDPLGKLRPTTPTVEDGPTEGVEESEYGGGNSGVEGVIQEDDAGGELEDDGHDSLSDILEYAAEEGLDFVEAMEEQIAVNITPRIDRIVSTMTRSRGIIRSFITEVKCCWEQGHWGWANTVIGPNIFQPQDEDSEWAFIIRCWKTWRFGPLIQLAFLSFGSLFFPPMGFLLFMYLWERSVITEIGEQFAKNTEESQERWLFVNGMCVDNNLGGTNALQLAKLFKKQIGFFHNPTQGLLFDLFECMVGRTFNFQTPVSKRLAKCLARYLLSDNYKRVVLVCHSQGGIIASGALDLMIKRQVRGLHKLEIYTFGSAADKFRQVTDPETLQKYPFFEHYANEQDYIAKIGTLHWDLPGNVFTCPRAGHILGEHYLPLFKKGLYKIYSGPSNTKSKLYSYVHPSNKPAEVILQEEEEERRQHLLQRRRASLLAPPGYTRGRSVLTRSMELTKPIELIIKEEQEEKEEDNGKTDMLRRRSSIASYTRPLDLPRLFTPIKPTQDDVSLMRFPVLCPTQ